MLSVLLCVVAGCAEFSSLATAHWAFCRHPQQPLQSMFFRTLYLIVHLGWYSHGISRQTLEWYVTLPVSFSSFFFFSTAESSVSNEVKDFQPVNHSCKNAVGHVICPLACSESPSLKGSHWGGDFTQALSVLCTVVVKLPVESVQLYFVLLGTGTIGLWF